MSGWATWLIVIFDVVWRVPPLFVLDAILKRTFLVPWIPDELSLWNFLVWMWVIGTCMAFSVIVFLLPFKNILYVYSNATCVLALYASYWFNTAFLENETILTELQGDSVPGWVFHTSWFILLVANIVIQCIMGFSIHSLNTFASDHLSDKSLEYFQTFMYVTLLQTSIWKVLDVPLIPVQWMPIMCVTLIAFVFCLFVIKSTPSVFKWFEASIKHNKTMVKNYGLQFFLTTQWTRLHVPNVLRVFWITRTSIAIVQAASVYYDVDVDVDLTVDNIMEVIKNVLTDGCDTVIALLGMTSVVSHVSHYIGLLASKFVGSDGNDDHNVGMVSAILFFILALQTGLTGMDPEKRSTRLYRNFCLLGTAILHFIHSMVNPLLMTLSANRSSSSFRRQVRPLLTCTFLIAFPVGFLTYLWSHHEVSTWLLAVSAFCIEVIIKVVITLMMYALFLIDTYGNTFWEELDDYIYYIKSAGSTIEFVFGIFLFCNGAWIMVFESGGTIRAIMMCIHAYFNIWVQALDGWKIFMKRRTAVNKINSLPNATSEQLLAHNDVCAICYQDLTNARMTRCRHFFHGICLRKWLYLQDNCPLCHQVIYQLEDVDQSTHTDSGVLNNTPAAVPNRDHQD